MPPHLHKYTCHIIKYYVLIDTFIQLIMKKMFLAGGFNVVAERCVSTMSYLNSSGNRQ